MRWTAAMLLAFGLSGQGCVCAGAPGLGPATTTTGSGSTEGGLFGVGGGTATTDRGATAGKTGGGGASGGLSLPDGVGPASGGKCTAPSAGDVTVRDPEGASLEDRLFGRNPAEVSVRAPEDPCP